MSDDPRPALQWPNCPECGARMALRTNRASGDQFFGCSTFPMCRGTRPIHERRVGVAPGSGPAPEGFGTDWAYEEDPDAWAGHPGDPSYYGDN